MFVLFSLAVTFGVGYGNIINYNSSWANASFLQLGSNASNSSINDGLIAGIFTQSSDGSFYLIGGVGNNNTINGDVYTIPSNANTNSETSLWKEDSSRIVPNELSSYLEVTENQYITINNIIYILPVVNSDILIMYDIDKDLWSSVDKPEHAFGQCLLYNQTYLFLIGGINNVSVESGLQSPIIQVFDPNNFEFLNNSNETIINNNGLPKAIIGHSCVSNQDGSMLYLFGGIMVNNQYFEEYSLNMFEYSFDSENWLQFNDTIQQYQYYASAILVSELVIYLIGGEVVQNDTLTETNQIEICDIYSTNQMIVTCTLTGMYDELSLPSTRIIPMIHYSPMNNIIYLVGGAANYNITLSTDAWQLKLSS